MNISTRLKTIAEMVDKCSTIGDIGTDHAYLPIYLIKSGVCENAIASDINMGPVKRARDNVEREGLASKIHCRLGAGFHTINPFEIQCAIIAGMGGNLIRDIIEEKIEVFKSLQCAILQPVQNPEVLRKHILDMGYYIIDEELCIDDSKFYEIIKVRHDENYERSHKTSGKEIDQIYYEVGEKLIQKKHPLLSTYVKYKLDKYNNILKFIIEDTELAEKRRYEIKEKIKKLEGILECL